MMQSKINTTSKRNKILRSRRHPRLGKPAILALAACAAGLHRPSSALADDYWNSAVTNSDWNNASNWYSGLPTASNGTARISTNYSQAIVLLDVNTPALSGLAIGSSGGAADVLNQTSSYNVSSTFESVGGTTISGFGEYNQSNGTNTAASYLDVGPTGTGIYNLQGTGIINLTGTGGGQQNFVVGDQASGTFNQTGGTINSSVPVYLGWENGGAGNFIHSGGTFNIGTGSVNQNLYLAYNSTSTGTYNLSGGNLNVNGNAYIGGTSTASGGAGVFNISGTGSANITGQLNIYNTSGTAVNLNTGGTLSVGSLNIGNGSAPNFQWSGGTLNITGTGRFYVDSSRIGSFGSLALGTNQTLNVSTANGIAVGDGGIGLLAQTGMSAVNSYSLFIGLSGTGNYAMNSSAALTVSYQEQVGSGATGIFNQSGGTHIVNGPLYLGVSTGSHGIYNLNSGSLFANGEAIGYLGGVGSLVQIGGSNTVGLTSANENLQIGSLSSNSVGTYTMNGSAATLTVNGSEYVGGYTASYGAGGTGVFNMSAGNAIVSGELCIWNTSGTTVNLTGGTLTVSSLNTSSGSASRFLGNGNSTGWTGGTLNITGSQGFALDSGPNTNGAYPLGSMLNISGTQSLNVSNGNLIVGNSSGNSGTLTQTGGAVASNLYGLTVAFAANSVGQYSLSGLGVLQAANESIGYSGAGTFNQTGGTNTVGSSGYGGAVFNVGYVRGSTGQYSLSSTGALQVYGDEIVGSYGAGTFNQTGGMNTITDEIHIGLYSGSTGQYILSSTGSLQTAFEVVGENGVGTFIQTGGTNTIGSSIATGGLTVGSGFGGYGGSGQYSLGPTGILQVYGAEFVGYEGAGSFNQAGGTHNIGSGALNQNLYLGAHSTGVGTYTLNGSNAALNVYGNAQLGGGPTFVGGTDFHSGGIGVMNISNGTATITGQLIIWSNAASGVNLAGGTLSVGSLNTSNGSASQFQWAAGTLNLSNSSLTVGSGGTLGSSLTLNSGMNLNLTGVGQSLIVTGAMNISGGGLNVPSITQTAGTFIDTGTLTLAASGGNAATYNLSGSTLATAAIVLNTGGNFNWTGGTLNITGSQGLIVDGNGPLGANLTLGGTQSLNVSGGSLIIANGSSGSLTQSGTGSVIANQGLILGFISGTGSYTLNNAMATLTVNGQESVGYFGNGIFNQSAGTQSATYLSIGALGTGSYLLSGGSLTTGVGGSAGNIVEYIGNDYSGGSFNQTGGTNTIAGTSPYGLVVGYQGVGMYYLNGTGILQNDGSAFIGYHAAGTFIQSGGTHNIGTGALNQNLYLGYYSNGAGSYTMNGSNAALNVYGNTYVGGGNTSSGGVGVLNISSGTATITGQLTIWNTAGSGVNLSGGTLSVGSLNTSNGSASQFQWAGGTFNVGGTNGFAISSIGPLSNSLNISTGKTLAITNTLSLTGGTLNISGGTVSAGSFTMDSTSVLNLIYGDVPAISASAVLAGTLNLTGTVRTLPETLLTYGSESGTFASTSGIPLGDALLYTSTALELVTSGPTTVNSVATATGNWNSTSEWTNSDGSTAYPNNTISTLYNANISGAGINNTTVTLPVSVTVSSLNVSNATLNISSTGALNLAGGTLNVQGGLSNNGLIVASGTISGNGYFVIGGNFNLSGNVSLTNASQFELTSTNSATLAGYQLQLNGTANLTAQGTLNLSGGSITGGASGAQMINYGLVNGPGAINVVFGNSGTVTSGSGLSLNTVYNSGTLTLGGNYNLSGVIYNYATATIGGTPNWTAANPTFSNQGGTATFTSDAGSITPPNVAVNYGSVLFSTTQHLASLTIASGTTTQLTGGGETHRSMLFTPALSDSGTLDLTNNDLDVQAGGSAELATITALLKQGFNNGTWTGTGITSTLAAGNSSHLTAIGVILNNQSGSALYTSGHQLDGFTPTAANDVLVKYTWYGDANIDGKVDGSDYSLIDNGYLNHLTGWYNGDFNYDGVVNGSDYTLIDNAFNTQGAQLSAEVADASAVVASQVAGSTTAVPEPTTLTLAGIATLGLLSRRHRRTHD